MPPVVVGAAILGTAAVGASVYAGNKAANAADKARESAAANNQATIDAANAQADKDRAAAAATAKEIADRGAADTKALIDTATANNAAQLAEIAKGNADTKSFQGEMLAEQQRATQEAKAAAALAIKNSAQKARNPNYSRSMSENARANRKGISSTMLTGPSGVDPASLTLGRQTLLGGATA